ncbi:hypothetical protein FOZ60_006864 [Perkinsus olseni]|uniref:Uncharacterized protein n=1 Tax=Perkinsus olseni TaxID=32597 RepID=A0A7J6NML8_PEROL|nr:hypothetical protein FOZ60_006864 [Perkinsus olseni]
MLLPVEGSYLGQWKSELRISLEVCEASAAFSFKRLAAVRYTGWMKLKRTTVGGVECFRVDEYTIEDSRAFHWAFAEAGETVSSPTLVEICPSSGSGVEVAVGGEMIVFLMTSGRGIRKRKDGAREEVADSLPPLVSSDEVMERNAETESAESHATTVRSASDAAEDLTWRAKKQVEDLGKKRRRSDRLKVKEDKGGAQTESEHEHGYHTRLNPLTPGRLRSAGHPKKKKGQQKRKKTSLTRRKGQRRASAAETQLTETRIEAQKERAKLIEDQLERDNPLDEMSWDLKKRIAVYLVLRNCYVLEPGCSKVQAEAVVSRLLGVSSKSLAAWTRDYEVNFEIAESKRGKHSKTFSPMYEENFAGFRDNLVSYIKENSVGPPGTANLTVNAVKDWVNTELQLVGNDCYSERTICRWLHYLGFELLTVKKTLYVDGHERPDVVADRMRLGKELEEVGDRLLTIDDDTLEIMDNPHATHVLISQDEKIHHSNDKQKRYWSDKSFTVLPSKPLGRTVMTSDFLSEIYAFVKYAHTEPLVPNQRAGSVIDVSTEGYYNNSRCLVDFEECSEAVRSLSEV